MIGRTSLLQILRQALQRAAAGPFVNCCNRHYRDGSPVISGNLSQFGLLIVDAKYPAVLEFSNSGRHLKGFLIRFEMEWL
jgi:hypothetical protein